MHHGSENEEQKEESSNSVSNPSDNRSFSEGPHDLHNPADEGHVGTGNAEGGGCSGSCKSHYHEVPAHCFREPVYDLGEEGCPFIIVPV